MQDSKAYIPISIGELIDKIAILTIKEEKIKDPDKLFNIKNELTILRNTFKTSLKPNVLNKIRTELKDLYEINKKLWNTEEELRGIETVGGPFEAKFVKLARSVYLDNDQRSRIKKSINLKTGSILVEEKSHTDIDIVV